ncbi:MAG: chorismate-binding protein [Muribaculaceae bacterium]|nr:chorismate-binding protein [Muribaculaceae bacterium]
MDSFFIYRLPGENEFIGGSGTAKKGLDYGFVISSFYNLKDATMTITKEDDFTLDSLKDFQIGKILSEKEEQTEPLFPFPEYSTLREEYLEDVSEIIGTLNEKEKTVYSRVICRKETIDLYSTLLVLEKAFPDAMIFCFHTPQSGTWIGATPEKLLSNRDSHLSTMALAGTREANGEKVWDGKNIEEHRIVTEYIAETFNRHGISFCHDPNPHAKRVGKLEHLCTEFSAEADFKDNLNQLFDFLYDLSPTPALCGLPKMKSFETIKRKERFSRAYYGGFTGPFSPNGDFSFYVILRSVRIEGERWCMYAGGGITASSVAEEEWEETENKASSILEKIYFIR